MAKPDLVERFHDANAELDLMGHLLTHPDVVEQVAQDLEPMDLAHKGAQVAFQAMVELWYRDEEISPLRVVEESLRLDPLFERSQVVDWMGRTDTVGSVATIVDHLLGLAVGRRVHSELMDALNRLREPGSDPLALAASVQAELEKVGSASSRVEAMSTAFDVAARSEAEVPWLIPGLLYRQDAVIVVAGEGAGKSLMARQVGLCAEAGLHPFTRFPITPLRVFTVDLENKRRAMTDGFRLALRAVRSVPGYAEWQPKGMVWEAPGGMNLLSATDRRRFTEAIRRTRPDLLFFGPIYKAFRPAAGQKEDAAALEVTAFLDELRARFDFGLWLEAHAPFGAGGQRDLRPYGTTVWQRWPEYGKGFRIDEKTGRLVISSFRGDRTRVWWPKELVTGKDGWPFTGLWESEQIHLRLQLNDRGWPEP